MASFSPIPTVVTAFIHLYLLLLFLNRANGTYNFYGNEIKERGGSVIANETRGQRCWIDDFQKESQLNWCYLTCYKLYISSNLQGAGPPLRVQIWTNTTQINQFVLKWEKRLTGYAPGRAYDICTEQAEVVEVTEFDRVGFTNEGIVNPVSFNFEIDDTATASKAHRTYWMFYENWNRTFTKIGEAVMVDNLAVRGVFSMGVNCSTIPPLQKGLQYSGNEPRPSAYTEGTSGTSPDGDLLAYIDGTPLAEGRLYSFIYKLDKFDQQIKLYLFIVVPSANYMSGRVLWAKEVVLQPKTSPQTFTDKIGNNGPMVNSSCRFGWLFIGQNPLYRTFDGSKKTYKAKLRVNSTQAPITSDTVMAPDTLANPYAYSMGVVINVSGGDIDSGENTGNTGTVGDKTTMRTDDKGCAHMSRISYTSIAVVVVMGFWSICEKIQLM